MPNRSKQKGERGERNLVEWLVGRGYSARKARGSDGRSLGLSEGVDIEVIRDHLVRVDEDDWVQLRCRPVPKWQRIPRGATCTVVHQDYESWDNATLIIPLCRWFPEL
jgi:hypothetical protein